MHEYKRQLMNVLRVLAAYLRIKDNPNGEWIPRTVIIAGKAAPGYATAKAIIKLANDVAVLINADRTTADLLRLVFLPNYGVSLAERIFPASDRSVADYASAIWGIVAPVSGLDTRLPR